MNAMCIIPRLKWKINFWCVHKQHEFMLKHTLASFNVDWRGFWKCYRECLQTRWDGMRVDFIVDNLRLLSRNYSHFHLPQFSWKMSSILLKNWLLLFYCTIMFFLPQRQFINPQNLIRKHMNISRGILKCSEGFIELICFSHSRSEFDTPKLSYRRASDTQFSNLDFVQ